MSKYSITMSIGSRKKLKNHIDAQAIPSGNAHYQSTILKLKDVMPRKLGLLHMLKMSSMRRSDGTHPLMVEVNDEKHQNYIMSYSNSINNRSSIVKNKEKYNIGLSNGNSLNMKN